MLGDLSRKDRVVLAVVWSAAFALAVMVLFNGAASRAGLLALGIVAFAAACAAALRRAVPGAAEAPGRAATARPSEPAPVAPAPATASPATPSPAAPSPAAPSLAARETAAVLAGSSEGDRPMMLAAPRESGADDLKRIKGVGPKLEALLNRMGVHHFDQIAAWTPHEVAWVDENLEGFRGRVTRDGWVDQARILADGGETAFSTRVAQGEVPTSRA